MKGVNTNVKSDIMPECDSFGPFNLFAINILLVVILLLFIGCEQSFQPIKENKQYPFSMYGYLDASADTQWVRITPPREQLTMPPILPSMQVTLLEKNTANSTVMHDSLFHLANGVRYINVWTTMDIKLAHTYQIEARNSDGDIARVEITIPENPPRTRNRQT